MSKYYSNDNSVDGPSVFECTVKIEYLSDNDEPSMKDDTQSELSTEVKQLSLNSTDALLNPASGLYFCLHCYKELELANVNLHMIQQHGYREIKFRCEQCDTKFDEKSVYLNHINNSHGPEMANCSDCNVRIRKKYLKIHLKNVHSSSSYEDKCEICGNIFKNKLSLKEHVRAVHTSVTPSKCKLCDQEFKSKKYLSNHIRNVHPKGDKIHKCNTCQKQFKSRICLHQHLKYVHPPENASVSCQICSKMFKSPANLAQHMRIVHRHNKKRKRNQPSKLLQEDLSCVD